MNSEKEWIPIYYVGMKLSLNMDDGNRTCEGVITQLDTIKHRYKVKFDEDVSIIPLDNPEWDGTGNSWPEEIHFLTDEDIDKILMGKVLGTNNHYC